MKTAAYRANVRKLIIMAGLVVLAAAAYLLVEVNPKYFTYAMRLRIPKLIVMLIAAFAIGGASIVFQSIIHNVVVTPLPAGNELPIYPDPYGSGLCGRVGQRSGRPCQRLPSPWIL